MNKKASIQLSINFLVILIICITLLGIGIFLMNKFIKIGGDINQSISKYHERKLSSMLDQGALVATYPDTRTVNRGAEPTFSLGISNEKGFKEEFYVYVEKDNVYSTTTAYEPKILYLKDTPFSIENNKQYFTPIKIIVPKEADPGTYIFDIYVCNVSGCHSSTPDQYKYGTKQKLYINVR